MIASRLPNGFIVLVMSPREATHLGDEILEPETFPWQRTESQMTGLEAKSLLREQVQKQAERDLKHAARVLGNEAEDAET